MSLGLVGQKLELLNMIIYKCEKNEDLRKIPERDWILMNAVWFDIVSENCFDKLESEIYISDSWIYKRISRFLLTQQFSRDELEGLYSKAVKPNITFFVNTPPTVTWARRKAHSKKDFGFLNNSYENCCKERFIEYQQLIYNNYQEYANLFEWIILDHNSSTAQACQRIEKAMRIYRGE